MIVLKPRHVWGKWIYEVTSDNIDHVQTLTGKPSLNKSEIEALKALGVEIKIDMPDGVLLE
jgi:hypothetical protein